MVSFSSTTVSLTCLSALLHMCSFIDFVEVKFLGQPLQGKKSEPMWSPASMCKSRSACSENLREQSKIQPRSVSLFTVLEIKFEISSVSFVISDLILRQLCFLNLCFEQNILRHYKHTTLSVRSLPSKVTVPPEPSWSTRDFGTNFDLVYVRYYGHNIIEIHIIGTNCDLFFTASSCTVKCFLIPPLS